MSEPLCPACARGPLAPAPRGRVRCPRGHEFSFAAYLYWDGLTGGRGPVLPGADGLTVLGAHALPEFVDRETGAMRDHGAAGYDLPLYLGYTCRPGHAAKLRVVAQTAQECLTLLRVGHDLRRYEPVVLKLLAAPGADDGLGWGRAA